MSSFFYNLGRALGPKVRKGQWLWQSLTGTERERVEAEFAVGRDIAAAMRAGMGVDTDQEAGRMVAELGAKLADASKNRHRRFEFSLVKADRPNAFALPGGFVFVTRPLFDLMEEPEELAFILGHEIIHVVEEHALERLVSDMTLGAAVRRLPAGGLAGPWLRSTGAQLLQSAYSRDTELLTDRLGARLALDAGFAPQAGTRLLERLKAGAGDRPASFWAYFSTHPEFDLRIAELRRYLGLV